MAQYITETKSTLERSDRASTLIHYYTVVCYWHRCWKKRNRWFFHLQQMSNTSEKRFENKWFEAQGEITVCMNVVWKQKTQWPTDNMDYKCSFGIKWRYYNQTCCATFFHRTGTRSLYSSLQFWTLFLQYFASYLKTECCWHVWIAFIIMNCLHSSSFFKLRSPPRGVVCLFSKERESFS